MWIRVRYLLFVALFISFNVFSQNQTEEVSQDTLRNLLNDANAKQVLGISNEFQMAWVKLPADQQDKIIKQVALILNTPTINKQTRTAYFDAVAQGANASQEGLTHMSNYIEVTNKVLEHYSPAQILSYFEKMNVFFKERSLFYANSNKLRVVGGNYTLEYVELAEPEPDIIYTEPEVEEEESDDYFDDWDDEPTDDDWNTEWEDEPEDDYLEDEQMVDAIRGEVDMPIIEGPVIKFTDIELNFVTPYDSVFVQSTAGTFALIPGQFIGDGGRFDWSMAGLSADSVYAEFNQYALDVRKPILKVEGAKLNYKGKLKEPVEGVFEYRSSKHDTTTDAHYPKFISYYNNIILNSWGPDMSYMGGFSMNGSKINSASIMDGEAIIYANHNDERRFKARSHLFNFEDSVVTAKRAAIVIYQGMDSIHHPAVRFRYDYKNKNLVLQKDKGGFRNTAFTATYFNIDFTADIIRWDLNSDSLNASIMDARRIVPAYFESTDHYNYEDYRGLGDDIYPFNPLAIVVSYSQKKHVQEFYIDELARYTKRDTKVLNGAMMFLAQKGLIGYDAKKGYVTMKSKARHLYNSRFGRKDYDNIIITSVIHNEPNSTINFADNYMKVRGVEFFKVSDSLNVVIEPDSSEITIQKDRGILFNGKITAGNFEYTGTDFRFKYDSFLINMDKINSIQFYVQEENSRGVKLRKKVDNNMVAVPEDSLGDDSGATLGTLYINRPNNKSSKIRDTNYPKFNAGQGAVVYFDKQDVLGGAYNRALKFEVPPFDIDSLGGEDPSSIEFEGKFQSGGIFPEFEERLGIMKDNSMGFEHNVPSEGYQLYHQDAKFYNHLKLDKKGLQGNGKVEHYTSDLVAEEFIFYPDSVVTQNGDYMDTKEMEHNGVIYPQFSAKNYKMKWLPLQDSMHISNNDAPLDFYNETASLDGTATVTGTGVYGKGLLDTRHSEAKSDNINFQHDRFSARHADFKLKSDNPEKPAMAANDVLIRFNLAENYAVIRPEVEGEAALEFPYAQFKTSITEARWDLNEEKITMKKPDDVPLESSYFYTTRKELDSLRFNATEAVYDIKTSDLKVSGIPYIVVADAKITPDNNEVLILENSKIGTLTNTTIVLDTLNGYHTLTDGVIDIISRNEFTGYATYSFVNALNDTVPVRMENFHLEEIPVKSGRRKEVLEKHTVANGSVGEEQNIIISPGMFYKGDMILYAHRPGMELSGYIKLDIHEAGYNTWIEHTSTGEQKEVMIDFSNGITEEGHILDAGIISSIEDNSLYNIFIEDKRIEDDEYFFKPSGLLFYNKEKNEYEIADTSKVSGNTLAGRVYAYNQDTKDVRFEGPATFIKPTEDFVLNSAVLGSGNMDEEKFDLNALMTINFAPVPNQAFEIMAADITDVITNLGAPEGLGDQTELLYKLAEIIGERATREYEKLSKEEHVNLGGFAKETSTQMMFSNIDMKWSPEYTCFYSEGNLGLSNILRTNINASLEGFMEVGKTIDGFPLFNLFVKASPASWFFFSYEDNQLLVYSSNNTINEVINKKSNGAKAKIGELVFAPADETETLNFINRFRLQYYGIDDVYSLDAEIEQDEVDLPADGFGGVSEPEESSDDDDGF